MFIGSLVASRFLSLIAHFVVTVIIFLSKVSKGINAQSVYKFICPGKLTRLSLICSSVSNFSKIINHYITVTAFKADFIILTAMFHVVSA